MHMASAKKTRLPHASRGLDGPAGATGWGAGRAGWVVSGASMAGAGTGVGAGSGAGAVLGAVLERSGLAAIDFSGIFGGRLMVSGAGTGTGAGSGSDIGAGAGTGEALAGDRALVPVPQPGWVEALRRLRRACRSRQHTSKWHRLRPGKRRRCRPTIKSALSFDFRFDQVLQDRSERLPWAESEPTTA